MAGGSIPVDPSIRSERLLTCADFDIESIRRAAGGSLWFGDEFGPYLLHTDSQGRVLEAPIPLPNFRGFPSALGGTTVNPLVQSPSNPQLGSAAAANLPDSGGFEGMALNTSRTKLYPLMEKAINGDPVREFGYIMDNAGYSIGDMTALSDHEFLTLERDGGRATPATRASPRRRASRRSSRST